MLALFELGIQVDKKSISIGDPLFVLLSFFNHVKELCFNPKLV